jgi:translation initiation factor 3 subunit C
LRILIFCSLQDENSFLELAERVQAYYERAGKMKRCARIAARRVEHIYYKLDLETLGEKKTSIDVKVLLDKLTNLIYDYGDERLKARTILCHIYYHALHGRFFEVTRYHKIKPLLYRHVT